MPKQVLREAYDIWEKSLGWVLATVSDDFDVAKGPIPADAPKQFFPTNQDAMRTLERLQRKEQTTLFFVASQIDPIGLTYGSSTFPRISNGLRLTRKLSPRGRCVRPARPRLVPAG